MKISICVLIALIVSWTTSTFSAPVSSDTQHPEWTTSIRGRELEAQYLHGLVDDAKARGQAPDPKWIERLKELEPPRPIDARVSPPPREQVTPAPSRIENPFSALEQQIQTLEMQLSTSSVHSTDRHDVDPGLKAQLQALYAQRPENQRPRPLDQGGDNCANVTVASLGANYFDSGTTTGAANDFTTCNGNAAPDVIYELTPTTTAPYTFNLCTSNYYDAQMELRMGGACPGSEQLACNDDYCGLEPYFTYYLTAGTPYFLIVDGAGTSSGFYDLEVYNATGDTCRVSEPAGAIEECPENEGLVNFGANDCDGGCDKAFWQMPPQFQSLLPGETVYGRYFAYQDSAHNGFWVDSDWYQFAIAEPCTVRWTARGESYTYVLLAGGNCPVDSLAWGQATACAPATAQAVLNPGIYFATVYPDFWQAMPPLNYAATLTVSPSDVHISGQFEAPGSFSGVSCGYSRCAYRPSNDNVIQVTIPQYGTWRFSLCIGSAIWDSYIYLSSTACGTPLASNDDYCAVLSQLDACLFPGVYYLTVEGYSSTDCGQYTLTVSQVQGACCYGDPSNPQCQDGLTSCQCAALGGTWTEDASCATLTCGPRPQCQNDANYGQAPFIPTEQWNAYRSDDWIGTRLFEDYSGLTNPVTSIRFWGFGADNSEITPCVEQPEEVNIGFWPDSSGWPTMTLPLTQYSLSLNGTFIGDYTLNGISFAAYQFDAVLPVPFLQPSGWVSVDGLNIGGVPDCLLWWLGSPYGNGVFRYRHGNLRGSVSANLAVCLAGQPPCASPLSAPEQLTCAAINDNGTRHIVLNWVAPAPGSYEIWSTTYPNNDGNPDGGLDTMWHAEGRVVVSNSNGRQTWVEPDSVTAPYKNYVVLQTCRPVNDNCENAIAVANGATSFTNYGASTDGPTGVCGLLGSDVWFQYTAACTGTVTVNTCTGTNYDSAIAAYAGTCGNLGAPIACNDDFCNLQSQISFSAAAGQTFLLRVGGFNGAQGPNGGVLTISCQ